MSTNLVGQTILGQFQVNAYVASGGMGVVYRVQDLKRSVPLAMKVLHVDLADDPSILKRFEREARALKKLTHPHIVPFYGLYKTRDFAFLVEHFVDGPSLKQYLRQQEKAALPIMEVLTYLKALSAALGYAHAHGVVHCDMKPGNVMIDKGGNVYLTDFGIARHAESTQTTLGMAGTPAYMSPEQIQSEPVSPATDVYALGVMLFELHTGRRPFRGKDSSSSHSGSTVAERIRVEHLTQPPPDPRRFNPDISEPLVQVILKALEKDPRERYHSTQEMFAAACEAAGVRLEDVPDRLPSSQGYEEAPLISAVAEPKRQVFPGFESRNNFVILGGIGVVLLFVILIITRPFTGGVDTLRLTQAPPSFTTETVDSQGGNPLSTPAPDAFSSPENTTSQTDLAMIHTAAAQTVQAELTQTARFVPPSETSTPTPTASPTSQPPASRAETKGEWVAYAFGSKRYQLDIFLMNIKSGEIRQLTSGTSLDESPSFSPDGRAVVYSSCRGDCELYVIDINNLTERQLTDSPIQAKFPDWCRDSSRTWIVFEGREANSSVRNVWMVNSETGESTQLSFSGADGRPVWSPDCTKVVFGRATTDTDNNGEITTADRLDMYFLDVITQNVSPLALTPGGDEFNFAWSPDGQWIAFCRVSRDTNGDGHINLNDLSELFIIKTDGSGERNLTQGSHSVFSPSWSPDGENIVFSDYNPNTGKQELWNYSLATGEFTRLTQPGPYYHPQWSP